MEEEKKLGTMPIGRLLVSMSIPMMLSFLIQALYNVVDSIFVAMISENALTAVSIAFPMQNIITALGIGTGVGMTALLSRYLGQGQQRDAEKIANVTFFLGVAYWVIFIIVGLCLARPYYTMQTDVTDIVEAGVSYLTVVCIVSLGAFLGMILEKMLTATGHAMAAMIAQITGAVINIAFDPLFIFGIGPFPALGVCGAAVATVLGQIVAALVALILVLTKQNSVRIHAGAMAPDARSLKDIYTIGLPSIVAVGLTSVMSFGINQILLGFSTTATAVFGIWMKLQNFCYMPIFGLNNGTLPILSYNYGAKNIDRVNSTIRLALKVGIIIMILLICVFQINPHGMLTLFSATENMMSIGTVALRLSCLGLPFGATCIIFSSSFQALGRSRYTLALNLCRQLILPVPVAWLLSLPGQLTPIWLTLLISEAISALFATCLRRKVKRQLIL